MFFKLVQESKPFHPHLNDRRFRNKAGAIMITDGEVFELLRQGRKDGLQNAVIWWAGIGIVMAEGELDIP
ncbi:hypothetical protein BC936DRAFT_141709 [Jimgerdemannia flammicorona]|uniref:Uncharacterized protein n=1 Tax=Jimgerdemannia flammicorona TaxID=994334 RepID=A0A433DFV0_9FUNG|nr:hypothetical protein BC936DRAFT_141709 [Jimgerdemannia flammicorona]